MSFWTSHRISQFYLGSLNSIPRVSAKEMFLLSLQLCLLQSPCLQTHTKPTLFPDSPTHTHTSKNSSLLLTTFTSLSEISPSSDCNIMLLTLEKCLILCFILLYFCPAFVQLESKILEDMDWPWPIWLLPILLVPEPLELYTRQSMKGQFNWTRSLGS